MRIIPVAALALAVAALPAPAQVRAEIHAGRGSAAPRDRAPWGASVAGDLGIGKLLRVSAGGAIEGRTRSAGPMIRVRGNARVTMSIGGVTLDSATPRLT